MTETWRQINGWPDYEASDQGRIRSFKAKNLSRHPAGYVLVSVLRDRYPAVCFALGGRRFKTIKIAVLVCTAFHGPKPSPTHEVAHNNGDNMDSRAENLRWATKKENAADRDLHGKTARGEKNGMTSLNEKQVREIRRLVSSPSRPTLRSIAKDYKVNLKTIQNIRDRVTWGWLI